MERQTRLRKSYYRFGLPLLLGCWLATSLGLGGLQAQVDTCLVPTDRDLLDELYIQETEGLRGPAKVQHAEPLYIDLIRDLGARKGEKEWNVGMGLTDRSGYDEYFALVEYEWAPINRLGLELELPVSFYSGNGRSGVEVPGSRLHSLKAAAQWSFWVSPKFQTTLALGYINELEINTFAQLSAQGNLFTGNVFNPFFIGAKRWGQNFHTLLYTGPVSTLHFGEKRYWDWGYEINSNFHYLLPGTRNFVGIEVNKMLHTDDFEMVLRPQMRVALADNLLLGIVTGIPISRDQQRLSTFLRLIWEPGHKVNTVLPIHRIGEPIDPSNRSNKLRSH